MLPAANDGMKPVRSLVVPARRIESCGLASFTFTHGLAAPNGMLPLPLLTVPFCAMSSAMALVALKKRTVVLAFGVPTGLSLSLLQAVSATAVTSASTDGAKAVKGDCTGPPD